MTAAAEAVERPRVAPPPGHHICGHQVVFELLLSSRIIVWYGLRQRQNRLQTIVPHLRRAVGLRWFVVRGERTVRKLRLSKALTIPDGTTVAEACRRMAARRVDTVLLTDAEGLLSGIVTDKDIATRVIAECLRVEQTIISKIMTRNPSYVMADTLAIEALQKIVQRIFALVF